MELWHFYRVLRRRKWLVLMTWALCVIGIFLYNRGQQSLYYGVTRIMERTTTVTYVPMFPQDVAYPTRDPEVRVSNLRALILSDTVLEPSRQQARFAGSVEDLRRFLTVEPLRNAEIIEIRVLFPDPDFAREMAQAIALSFREFYRNLNSKQVSSQRLFIERQLPPARDRWNQANKAMELFKADNKLVASPTDQGAMQVRVLNDARLSYANLQMELVQAIETVKHTKEKLDMLEETRIQSITHTDSPEYTYKKQRMMVLEMDLQSLRRLKTDEHPDVIALTEQLEEAKRQFEDVEREHVSASLEIVNPLYDSLLDTYVKQQVAVESLRARVTEMGKILAEEESRTEDLPRQQSAYADLALDTISANEEYLLLRSKLVEAKLKEQQTDAQSSIEIVEDAKVVDGPRLAATRLILAFVLGLLLACGIAFLLHYMDNTVRTPDQAEELLELPIFAVVPSERFHSLAHGDSSAALVASYEMLSTNLVLGGPELEQGTYVIASAEPNVGRSTTVSNLGVTLARDGARVIVVDSDFRQPTQHKFFQITNDRGLSNVLAGTAQIEDVLVKTTQDGLMVIPTGPLPANPVRLLRGKEMKDFVAQINDYADFILFDTPAGVTFADASLVAAHAKNVIVVHCAGKVPRGAEEEFRRRLERVNANLVGAILNRVRREDSHGYFFFQRAYRGVVPGLGGEEVRALTGSES